MRVKVIDWEIESLAIRQNNVRVTNQLLSGRDASSHEHSSDDAVQHDVQATSEKSPSSYACGDSQVSSESKSPYCPEEEEVCSTPRALLQEVLIVLDVLGPWCKCAI